MHKFRNRDNPNIYSSRKKMYNLRVNNKSLDNGQIFKIAVAANVEIAKSNFYSNLWASIKIITLFN